MGTCPDKFAPGAAAISMSERMNLFLSSCMHLAPEPCSLHTPLTARLSVLAFSYRVCASGKWNFQVLHLVPRFNLWPVSSLTDVKLCVPMGKEQHKLYLSEKSY